MYSINKLISRLLLSFNLKSLKQGIKPRKNMVQNGSVLSSNLEFFYFRAN